MRDGDPKLTDVARKVALGSRTLQRRLKDQGLDFKKLVDDTRHRFSLNYLRDPQHTLTDIAYLLGYSEVSAFNRAFKRWTGSTPVSHRRRAHEDHRHPRAPRPQSLWRAAEAGREWHGFRHQPGEGLGTSGRRQAHGFTSPKVRFTPEERLKDMDAQGVDVQVRLDPHAVLRLPPRRRRRGGPWRARSTTRSPRMARAVAQALRRPRHAADAGRQGGHRRAGARGDRARPQGRRARHAGERRAVGRAEVPAVLQGRRGDGRRAVLPPAAAAQLPDGAHAPLRALQQPRRHPRRRDRRRDPDLRRRPGGLPGPQGVHRPRRRPGLLRDGTARPRLAEPPEARAASRSRRARTSAGSTTTP